jgi:fructuronate reductase
VGYIDQKVSFPISVIDRIVPQPSPLISKKLQELGYQDVGIEKGKSGILYSQFVNCEETKYLVIEDKFVNGRAPFEKVGVIMTDAATAQKFENMKVCACLNPLHTALAIFGCLLDYTSISAEMKDTDIVNLIKHIGYQEELPVAEDPGIIAPKKFMDECINKRFPNPNIPDTPQRIAMDTSQKLPIRFGVTIKKYGAKAKDLRYIPYVFAGWFRYLLGKDDFGDEMPLSPDPLLDELRPIFADIRLGSKITTTKREQLRQLLSNQEIFGVDLVEVGLADKVIALFAQMIAARGEVREMLKELK